MLTTAVGIFVVGVAAAIAVPQIQEALRKARAAEVVAELNEFATAFAEHARQHGWPPATRRPGEIPVGMESALDATWAERTPTGLRYLWAPETLQRGQRYRAAIVLWRDKPIGDEDQLMREIDRQIDDGDLLAGKFQLGHREQAFLVLER